MQKKSISRYAFFNLRALIGLLLCAATAYFILIPIRSGLAFLHPQAPSDASQGTLTFEERVSYQRAVEEVYWRHRIWPRDRGEGPDPKPSLDAVMSQAQLEKKVAEYLRNSQALEDYWQRPITAEQLQAEMDRMAQHTQQPEVLQALFEAQRNDHFLIAECLARPAMSDRLLTNCYAFDQRIHGGLKQRAEADLQSNPAVEQMKQMSGKYSEIELIKSDGAHGKGNRDLAHRITLNSHEWDETLQKLAAPFAKTNPPSGKFVDATVASGASSARRVPAATDPKAFPTAKGASITQIKTGVLSSLQEDESRYYATAVINKAKDHLELATVSWLKEPFESWQAKAESQVPTGPAAPSRNYTLPNIAEGGCIEDTWTATAGAPSARSNHTAVWTGSEMIVWGGLGAGV